MTNTTRTHTTLERWNERDQQWFSVGSPLGQERALIDVLKAWKAAKEVWLVIDGMVYRFRLRPERPDPDES